MRKELFNIFMDTINPNADKATAWDNFQIFGSWPTLAEEYFSAKFNSPRMTKVNHKGYDLENGMEIKFATRNSAKGGSIMVAGMKNKGEARLIVFMIVDPKHGRAFYQIMTPQEFLKAKKLDKMPRDHTYSNAWYNEFNEKGEITHLIK